MRKSKLTPQEVQEAEQAADERKYRRGMGFSLMDIRDRGWVKLSTGHLMFWHVDRPLQNDEMRRGVPPGHFVIDTGKQDLLFEADEFQKYVRWC